MNENPNDVPRWVRAVLGQPPSRQSAVFLLMVGELFTLLAALVPIITLIGSLLDGWRTTWSSSATVLLVLVAALAVYDIWVWRAIRWMDRHGKWPAQLAPTH
jgi:hypothetical protein